jgi:ribokinase
MVKKLCVIGSFNIDMTATTQVLPKRGETVLMDRFELLVGGGKGGNQAIALGRLGADVRMAGLLGDRFFGAQYLETLRHNGVVHDTVEILKDEYPGVAYVAVDERGDNLLFVYSGANKKVTPEYIDRHWDKLSSGDIFLFQQEIPRETNLYAMRKLAALGKCIILDPAPAGDFMPELLRYAGIVTPNEVELAMISGIEADGPSGCRRACAALHDMGAKTVIAKMGGAGAYISAAGEFRHVPAFKVNAVDTTAAGDSFNAGLAFGLAAGCGLEESVVLAHAVAGIATTQLGAQPAMPRLPAVMAFLRDRGVSLNLESIS